MKRTALSLFLACLSIPVLLSTPAFGGDIELRPIDKLSLDSILSQISTIPTEGEASYLYKECKNGDALSCSALGLLYQNGDSVTKDKQLSINLLGLSCAKGYGGGCADLAYRYKTGFIVNRDRTRAAKLYKRACDLRNGLGCGEFGAALFHGKGIEKSIKEALPYLELACHNGHSESCPLAAKIYERGTEVEKDEFSAAHFYQAGCYAVIAGDCDEAKELTFRLLAGTCPTTGTYRCWDMAYWLKNHLEEACSFDQTASCQQLDNLDKKIIKILN